MLKVGTFSKPIATGLRIGWVQGREDFIDALGRVKYDMGNSPVLLRALAEYVGSQKLEEHLEEMRPCTKRSAMRCAAAWRSTARSTCGSPSRTAGSSSGWSA